MAIVVMPETRHLRRPWLWTFVGVVAVVAGLLATARNERTRLYWEDAKAAASWHNPLCTTTEAFRGFTRARGVARRTTELMGQIRFVGEDAAGLFEYDTPYGTIWMPQPDDLWSLAIVLAEQEHQMYGAPEGLGVRSGDVVIDGGAHVGLFARWALAAGASKVITFEVTPKAIAALRRNLAAEIANGRVVVVHKGVWHEDATLPLVVVDGCSVCNSVTHQLPAAMEVPLTTIDAALAELGIDRVDFIKLDIENAEANALRGARATLARDRPRVAVALENAKARYAYGHEVLGVMLEAFAGYEYRCGACTSPDDVAGRVLPDVLHFYTRDRARAPRRPGRTG